jgi:hypothetical protein
MKRKPDYTKVTQWFAEKMRLKLVANKQRKTHWSKFSTDEFLYERLRDECKELKRAIKDGGDIISEAVDVANFAMMIADNKRHEEETK